MAVLRNVHRLPAYNEPMFSKQEMLNLNQLVGAALTNRSICQRLVNQRDADLQGEFNLAPETWHYIMSIKVTSLEELCQAIMQLQTEERAS